MRVPVTGGAGYVDSHTCVESCAAAGWAKAPARPSRDRANADGAVPFGNTARR
jgi:hypothetical protein